MSVLRNLQLTGAGRDRAMEQLQAFGWRGLPGRAPRAFPAGKPPGWPWPGS